MKGKAKSKVVTSGRLTGPVRVSRGNLNWNQNPEAAAAAAAAARPEPAYSLYSTDSEDQVNTLHEGLDRCAALLSGILQADKAASPGLPRSVKGGAVKTRLSSSLGKKSIKKAPTKKDQKGSQPGPHGPASATPRRHRPTPTAPHSGVKLQPPQKKTPPLPQLRSPSAPSQTLQHSSHPVRLPKTSTPPLQPKTSVLQQPSSLLRRPPLKTDHQSVSDGPLTHCKTASDGEEETVPVKDIKHGQEDTHCGEEHGATEEKAKTIHFLLRDLKALIAGQGGVAESLLGHLERIVSPPYTNVSSSDIQTESAADPSSLQSQNTQVLRHVNIVDQQITETEEAVRNLNLDTQCNSEGLGLQEEPIAAQSRLRELQDELTELRKAHQDTQSQLRDIEAQNALMKTELEATRSRLLGSEQEKNELSSLARQRLEEIENLNRLFQSRCLSDCPAAADSLVKNQHLSQHQPRQDPPVLPTERVTQYLMSLGWNQPAERELPDVRSLQSNDPADATFHQQNSPPNLSRCFDEVESRRRRRVFNPTLFQCDLESVCSGWSMNTGSTFNTRDETAFRVGLAALDASIASLQKTFQLDLRR